MRKKRKVNKKIFKSEKVRLETESQTGVKIKTAKPGLIIIEPLQRLYSRHNCLAGADVYQKAPRQEFGILIANFESKHVYLSKGQTVATAGDHPVALMESDITHSEMVGFMDTKNIYHKRNKSTRDIDVINKHIADAKEAAVNKADETVLTMLNLVFTKSTTQKLARCSGNTKTSGLADLET